MEFEFEQEQDIDVKKIAEFLQLQWSTDPNWQQEIINFVAYMKQQLHIKEYVKQLII